MQDNLIVPLFMSAYAGIAFVAYNHQVLFKEIVWKWILWSFLGLAILVSWDASSLITFFFVRDYIPDNKLSAASEAAFAMQPPDLFIQFVGSLPLYLFMVSLVSERFHKENK